MSEQTEPHSKTEPDQNKPAPAPRPTSPEEWWQARKATIERAAQAGELNATLAIRLAGELNEKNLPGLYQIIGIFGRERTEEAAKEALGLFAQAEDVVIPAKPTPAPFGDTPASSTATHRADGKRRNAGGIFFNLMRQYAKSLRLDWQSLRIPMLPGAEGYQPKSKATERGQSAKEGLPVAPAKAMVAPDRPATEQLKVKTGAGIAQAKNSDPPAAQPATTITPSSTSAKATRLKATLIGELIGQPKPNPQGQAGLIELTFRSEISPNMPKGLPNSGSTEIKVWCTEKQWRKVSLGLQPDDRFIIEGEVLTGVNRELEPFVRVLALRLTTARIEQAVRDGKVTSA